VLVTNGIAVVLGIGAITNDKKLHVLE
jgi:hypothetical protein